MNIDFTQVEDKGFDLLPKGQYKALVANAEIKESKATPGNYYINWEFEISEGEYSERKVWAMTTLAPGKEWKAKAFFKALNFDVATTSFDVEGAVSESVGSDCIIDVVIKKGTGDYSDKNDVNKISSEDTIGSDTSNYL